MMTRKQISKPTQSFTAKTLLSIIGRGGRGKKMLTLEKNQILFSQGEPSYAVFYILKGKVKLTVVSPKGKEAVIAVLERGAFLGEGCLTAQSVRMKTATSMGTSRIVRIEKAAMLRVLHEEPALSELFVAYLLSRNIRIEEDLVDQLFNSSEKRLARVLLLLARFGKESNKTELLTPKISQETLADMIGITRSKVSFYLNKFRNLGFIDNIGGLHVHSSLLNIVLQD
jgi:CRP/FNR family cyclic AMP-dependent transcriptional regulator